MQYGALAVLTESLASAPTAIKLAPYGDFRARDGRPKECSAWRIAPALLASLLAEFNQRNVRGVIDYEHQTLLAATNGKPAPAAGWFSRLEWREGDGLYAVGVEWTAAASAMLKAGEYKYISPVFTYDRQGNVLQVMSVALTNNPALDVLPELGLVALSRNGLLREPERQNPHAALRHKAALHIQKYFTEIGYEEALTRVDSVGVLAFKNVVS